MSELTQFTELQEKLENVCMENDLNCRFEKDRYPISLIITPVRGTEQQMTMLETAEDGGYASPGARLVFKMQDGELIYEMSEKLALSDALFGKLKNLFKKMYTFWTGYFFRSMKQNGQSEGLAADEQEDELKEEDSEKDLDDEEQEYYI